MISKMAMEDIEALKEDGIEVTPEDIIRLNAFGLKVERNTDSSEYYIMPRVSILGEIVIHEPTIGSEIWMSKVGRVFDLDDTDTYIQIRAYSLSLSQDQLVDPENKELVKQAVSEFLKKVSNYTMTQLQEALAYAVFGNDVSSKEERPSKVSEKEKEKDDNSPEDENYCYEVGLLREGLLFNLGSPEEIKRLTVSELEMYIDYQMFLKYGSERTKSQHQRNLVEYYGVLDEIRSKNKHG